MRRYIFIIGMICCSIAQSNGQSCRQIKIADEMQQKILRNYIEESIDKGAFVADKGVVEVKRFTNENGRPGWEMNAVVDDRYKDNPPIEWADLDGDIILFYDTKSSRFDVVKHDSPALLIKCIEEAVGDRLYVRPPKKDRVIEVDTPNGKVKRIKARRIRGGNSSNGLILIFESDGTITKLRSV